MPPSHAPSKLGAARPVDVSATNSTANVFLGARLPPWEVQGRPRRPRRPTSPNPPLPSPPATAQTPSQSNTTPPSCLVTNKDIRMHPPASAHYAPLRALPQSYAPWLGSPPMNPGVPQQNIVQNLGDTDATQALAPPSKRPKRSDGISKASNQRGRTSKASVQQSPGPSAIQMSGNKLIGAFWTRRNLYGSFRMQGEIHRTDYLRGACERQDWFFLILHQLSCSYTDDVGQLLPWPIDLRARYPPVLSFLSDVFNSHQPVSPTYYEYWAQFPCFGRDNLSNLIYIKSLQELDQWLPTFGTRWNALIEMCKLCYRPPLVEDIESCLASASPTLQRAAFDNIVDFLWPSGDPALLSRARSAFERNQNNHGGPNDDDTITEALETYEFVRSQTCVRQDLTSPRSQTTQAPSASVPSVSHLPSPPQRMTSHSQLMTDHASHAGTNIRLGEAFDNGLLGKNNSRQLGSVTSPHYVPTCGVLPVTGLPAMSTTNPRAPSLPQEKHFFPRLGEATPQVSPPNRDTYALHLAHLRSPVLKLAQTLTRNPFEYYQFVSEFLLPPQPLSNSETCQQREFILLENVAKQLPSNEQGCSQVQHLDEATLTFRIRCVENSQSNELDGWLVKDCTWPPGFYFTCNDERLHPRHRLHFGRDLPIDVTPHLRVGQNTIKIWTSRPQKPKSSSYTIAVEGLRILSGNEYLLKAMSRTIPPSECLTTIKNILTKNSSDAEIECLSPVLSISLRDPILGTKIWDVPARSQACLHRECFDLSTFLKTRSAKGDRIRDPDSLYCPICKASARPDVLVVDGWMVEVRKKLEATGSLDATAILVDKDGNWHVKSEPERQQTRASGGKECENGVNGINVSSDSKSKQSGVDKPQHEVIELD